MTASCQRCGAPLVSCELGAGCPACAGATTVTLRHRSRRRVGGALGLAGLVVAIICVAVCQRDPISKPPAGLVAEWIPEGSDVVAGVTWSALHTSEAGRRIADALLRSERDSLLATVAETCQVDPSRLLLWVSKTLQGDRDSSLLMLRLGWQEPAVDQCLGKLAAAVGVELEISRDGLLREYGVADESAFVAWLTDDTVAVVEDSSPDRQRDRLTALCAASRPGTPALAALARRIDGEASFWLAMVRPPSDPAADWGEGSGHSARAAWYQERIAAPLGATPKGIYGGLIVGDGVTLRGGARYETARKASRVAERARRRIAAARAPRKLPAHSFGNLHPVLAGQLERNLAAAYAAANQVRTALLDQIDVSVDGDYVVFSLRLDREQVDRLSGGAPIETALERLNRYLPDELRLRI